MTTNQTIDGVPRELLRWLDDFLSDGLDLTVEEASVSAQLRALLDAKPVMCHGCMADGVSPDHFDSAGKCKAAQPQGEPVAYRYKELQQAWESEKPWELATVSLGRVYLERKELAERGVFVGRERETYLGMMIEPLYAEQPAPVAVVPDGYCIMPRQLTAENGAKALLLGEFKLLVTKECPECCELEEPTEGCSICDGEGEYGQKHTIPWDQIKFIYSKAVSGLAVKAESAKSR